ncbi:MAG TPA: GH3 auxin-responsive promoter family protein, partial [Chitinophagaceae bacterium]|nr:GH3 auxin-responsive promoter family protein [Chitinophagaceae bacterium]
MKILSPAISRLARLRYNAIDLWVQDPVAAQREVLQDLVTHAQHTQIGRKYGFTDLFRVRTFKQRVPIHEYDDL